MKFVKYIKENMKGYYVSLLIMSIGAYVIVAKTSTKFSPFNWNVYLQSLVLGASFMFICMCGLFFLLNNDWKN